MSGSDVEMPDLAEDTDHRHSNTPALDRRSLSEQSMCAQEGIGTGDNGRYQATTRSASPEKHFAEQPALNLSFLELKDEFNVNGEFDENASTHTAYETKVLQDLHANGMEEIKGKLTCDANLRVKPMKLESLKNGVYSPQNFDELQYDLAKERRLRGEAEMELCQKAADADAFRKKWKQMVRELDEMRSQSQQFYQVTDQYLRDLTNQLRYNIMCFAEQHFEGKLRQKTERNTNDCWNHYLKRTTIDTATFEAYLFSEDKAPSVIQALIWRVLAEQIFDHFRWAGNACEHVYHLYRFLRPKVKSSAAIDEQRSQESERKFQVWNAMTAGLLLETSTTDEKSHRLRVIEEIRTHLARNICQTLDPYRRSHGGDFIGDLEQILDDAVTLDKEISRQVARVEWILPNMAGEEEIVFDPAEMVLEKEENPPKASQRVLLIVAPGMKKRGKSTGDDFHIEQIIMPSVVSCEPPRRGAPKVEIKSRRK